jgi:hypothetical protein
VSVGTLRQFFTTERNLVEPFAELGLFDRRRSRPQRVGRRRRQRPPDVVTNRITPLHL